VDAEDFRCVANLRRIAVDLGFHETAIDEREQRFDVQRHLIDGVGRKPRQKLADKRSRIVQRRMSCIAIATVEQFFGTCHVPQRTVNDEQVQRLRRSRHHAGSEVFLGSGVQSAAPSGIVVTSSFAGSEVREL
jgi:hypothetical protein